MTDSPHIPEQWLSLLIGEIADVVAGGTPKASDPANFAEPGTQIAWLTPADLSKYSEKYISHGARDLSKTGYEGSSAKLMPAGTLLFSSRAPIGYVAVAANEISTNQGFKNFVLPTEIDPSYAYYFLRSIRDVAESMGTGTTFKEISGANAKKLPFILPPLAEQKVIADKLDTLLAQVENTKARLERVPKILKRFRQSVLAAAVSGRLIDSASAAEQSVGDLAEVIGGLTKNAKRAELPIKKPFLRVANVYANELRLDDVHEIGIKEKEIAKAIIQTGDLLIVEGNGSIDHIGRVALWQGEIKDCVHQNHLIKVRVDTSQLLPKFALYFLMSPLGKERIAEKATSGAGLYTLSISKVSAIEVPVFSTEEQTEIVRQVDHLFAHADRIEQQVNNALARVNNLTQSILAKAFRGELTEQWRKDNPELISGENSAEALLERIKAERAAAKPPKKTRKRKTTV